MFLYLMIKILMTSNFLIILTELGQNLQNQLLSNINLHKKELLLYWHIYHWLCSSASSCKHYKKRKIKVTFNTPTRKYKEFEWLVIATLEVVWALVVVVIHGDIASFTSPTHSDIAGWGSGRAIGWTARGRVCGWWGGPSKDSLMNQRSLFGLVAHVVVVNSGWGASWNMA